MLAEFLIKLRLVIIRYEEGYKYGLLLGTRDKWRGVMLLILSSNLDKRPEGGCSTSAKRIPLYRALWWFIIYLRYLEITQT